MASRQGCRDAPAEVGQAARIDKIESGEKPLEFLMRPGVSRGGRAGVEPFHIASGLTMVYLAGKLLP